MIVDEEEHESPVEAVLRDLQREVKAWRLEEEEIGTSLNVLRSYDEDSYLTASRNQCPTLRRVCNALREAVASDADKEKGKDEDFVLRLLASIYTTKRKRSWWGPSIAAALDLWATTGSGLAVDLVKDLFPGCPTWKTLHNHLIEEARRFEDEFCVPQTREGIFCACGQWGGGDGYTVYRTRNSLLQKDITLPIYTQTIYFRLPASVYELGAQHEEYNAPGSSRWKKLTADQAEEMLTVSRRPDRRQANVVLTVL